MERGTVTAFAGERRLVSGTREEVARMIGAARPGGPEESVLVFDDETGAQVDLDLGLSEPAGAADVAAEPDGRRKAGRPKLGVVAREVTLLPRHWEWLLAQPGGASVTLRKLVEAARKAEAGERSWRRAREAADRFMTAMLGNAPRYEDASRALYRGDLPLFLSLTEDWPTDLRDHARRLAAPGFRTGQSGEPT